MSYPVAKLQLRWLTPEEGGRKSGPPPGPVYVPTARFAEDPIDRQFSVGLRRLDKSTDSKEWKDTQLMLLFSRKQPRCSEAFNIGINFEDSRRPERGGGRPGFVGSNGGWSSTSPLVAGRLTPVTHYLGK